MAQSRYHEPVIDEEGNEVECSILGCDWMATYQEDYDEALCLRHHEEADDEAYADWMIDRYREDQAIEERFMNSGSPYRVW